MKEDLDVFSGEDGVGEADDIVEVHGRRRAMLHGSEGRRIIDEEDHPMTSKLGDPSDEGKRDGDCLKHDDLSLPDDGTELPRGRDARGGEPLVSLEVTELKQNGSEAAPTMSIGVDDEGTLRILR